MPTLKDCLGKIKTSEKEARFFNQADKDFMLAQKGDSREIVQKLLDETTRNLERAVEASKPKPPDFKKALESVVPCIAKTL